MITQDVENSVRCFTPPPEFDRFFRQQAKLEGDGIRRYVMWIDTDSYILKPHVRVESFIRLGQSKDLILTDHNVNINNGSVLEDRAVHSAHVSLSVWRIELTPTFCVLRLGCSFCELRHGVKSLWNCGGTRPTAQGYHIAK